MVEYAGLDANFDLVGDDLVLWHRVSENLVFVPIVLKNDCLCFD